MNKIQIIEIKDHEHGLLGLGDISYRYTVKDREHELVIHLKLLNQSITYKGDEAKNIYHRTISDSDKSTVNLLKRIASESCGIPLLRIGERTRKMEVVFARAMVFWYLKTHLDFTLKSCGDVFGLDHATAINGIKVYSKELKYLSTEQVSWKRAFNLKLLEYKLI